MFRSAEQQTPNITSSRFPKIGTASHQKVLIQEGVRSWKPAIIVEKFGPNDYLLKTEDMAEYRRNRYHIRPLREPPVNPTRSRQSADEENPDSQPNPEVLGRRSSIEHRDSNLRATQSGRIVETPERFNF
ncbi:hypothetical protein JTB14_007590 [Gonioctena quinquepunctata]|nr:hypothetical protein JTB14_007590 [Gonioctena quinquepunctata]